MGSVTTDPDTKNEDAAASSTVEIVPRGDADRAEQVMSAPSAESLAVSHNKVDYGDLPELAEDKAAGATTAAKKYLQVNVVSDTPPSSELFVLSCKLKILQPKLSRSNGSKSKFSLQPPET